MAFDGRCVEKRKQQIAGEMVTLVGWVVGGSIIGKCEISIEAAFLEQVPTNS